MKTYRIYETDLETLERELPRLMDKSDCNDALTRSLASVGRQSKKWGPMSGGTTVRHWNLTQ